MKKRCVLLVLAVAALAAPASALAGGVVLKVQPTRHLVAIATTRTSVKLVHTAVASRLHVGERVAMTSKTLRNGTLAASRISVRGRMHRVHFRGRLLSKAHGRLLVSAGGAVIAVRPHARTVSSAKDTTPSPGSVVDVTATVEDDDSLSQDSVTVFSPTSPGGSIEGQLTIGTGTITVTSDSMSLVISVPTGFDLSSFKAGQEVLATFSQQSNGSLLLVKLSGDDNAQQADNQNEDGHHGDGQTGDGGHHGDGENHGDGGDDGGGGDD